MNNQSINQFIRQQRAKATYKSQYTMIIVQDYVHLLVIIISFSSPTLSFIPDLKPSFSANSSHCSLSFFSSELTT